MKKGFTLIELLAVIVILAILALIVSPIISGVISDAKEAANIRSVEGIIKSAEFYGIKNTGKINDKENIYSKLTFSGKRPTNAEVYIDNVSSVAVAVIYDDKCYYKDFHDSKVISGLLNNGACTIHGGAQDSMCFQTDGHGVVTDYLCGRQGYIFKVDENKCIELVTEKGNIDPKYIHDYCVKRNKFYTETINSSIMEKINSGYLYDQYEVDVNTSPFIPNKIGDENIVGVDFYNSLYFLRNDSDMLTISEGIKFIRVYSLRMVNEVVLPNSLLYFDSRRIDYDYTVMTNSKGINYIGNSTNPYLVAVSVDDDSKSSYELNSNTKILNRLIFYDCKNLTSMVIPEGVEEIGSSAFYNCTNLTNITIPSSVEVVGDDCFSNTNLVTTISGGIHYLGNDTNPYLVAYKADSIGSINNNTKIIYSDLFYNNTSLTSFAIPNSVTNIGLGAFSSTGLTSITIPDSVKFIDNLAFGETNIVQVTLPSSVIFYHKLSFDETTNITKQPETCVIERELD